MKKFIWRTKGQTLLWMKKRLKNSEIPYLIVFTYDEWKTNSKDTLNKIRFAFNAKKIAIRSSSLNEDSLLTSNAGAFESYLDVPKANLRLISEKINQVFSSYGKKINDDDEVIIQEMINDISISGVIFTHEIKNKAPYYSINYDDISGSSTTVTSGTSNYSNKTLYIHRGSKNGVRSKRFSKLLKSTFEIENLLKNNALDIEFIVTNNLTINILQVRPIINNKKLGIENYKLINYHINKLRNTLKNKVYLKQFEKIQQPLFGQMPDWNPAEMIGVVPRNLAYSLYKTLITEKIWCKAREKMGYKKSKTHSLMYNFCGHPFIDVNASFYSFIPNKLNNKIAKKLVNFWTNKLKLHPEFHDKVEFKIAFTTYTFDLEDEINNLPLEIFNSIEKKSIKNVYYEHLTQLIKSNDVGSLKKSNLEILKLKLELKKIIIAKTVSTEKLVKICQKYGTLPFAKLARHAFISTSLIKSLSSKKILSESRVTEFLSSIKTILSEMLEDIQKLKNNSISEFDFKIKYGHLRPGTYDINSKSYKEIDPSEIFGNRKIKKSINEFILADKEKRKINKVLKTSKLPFKDAYKFLDYIKLSIQAREYAKFNFTKLIDLIFENVKNISKNLKISLDDLSYLTVENFLNIENSKNTIKRRTKLMQIIKKNKKQHKIFTAIKLPQLIMDPNHAVVIPFQVSLPNFITNKTIEGYVKILKNYDDSQNLDGKIVVIESADPGYDWLFSTKFSALITKYGGTNSHMAIRCAELSIPAAIGCGEQLFEQIKKYNKVKLDCASLIIQPL